MMRKMKMRIIAFALIFLLGVMEPISIPFIGNGIMTVEAATSVKISKKNASIYVGKSLTLKITGSKSKVKWSSSNKAIAIVNSKGKVTGKKKGTVNITAKVSGKKYVCKIIVKSPNLNITKKTLQMNQSFTLKLNGATAKTFSSNDKTIATVNSKGKVVAKKKGVVTITVRDTTGKKYICKVTVKAKPTYGSVSGTVTYYYNSYRGNVADTGSYVLLIPTDGSAKKVDSISLYFGDENNRIYQAQVDGTGKVNISHVESGEYLVYMVSNNTNSEEYYNYLCGDITKKEFLETYSNCWYSEYVSKKAVKSISESSSIGGKKYFETIIKVYQNEVTYFSHDFGMTYF